MRPSSKNKSWSGQIVDLEFVYPILLFNVFEIVDLEFMYQNLLYKVLYDDYWDCYKHITGH